MREGWVVAEFIRRGLLALPEGTWVGFLTVTEPSVYRTVDQHAESMSRFLEDLWKLLDEVGGVRARPYVAVREFQQRGAVHTHSLVANWPYVDPKRVQSLAWKHGLGAISLRGTFRIGGPSGKRDGKGQEIRNVAAYLAKTFGSYLSKSSGDHSRYCLLMPKGYRQVHHSRDWADGLTLTGLRGERLAGVRSAPVDDPELVRLRDRHDMAAAIALVLDEVGGSVVGPVDP